MPAIRPATRAAWQFSYAGSSPHLTYSSFAILSFGMGGKLIREARRRAGVSQAELARRIGTTQSAGARLERGNTEPSLKRVREVLRALGLDLTVGIVPLDDSDWLDAKANLKLDVDARVRQNEQVLRIARGARRQAKRPTKKQAEVVGG